MPPMANEHFRALKAKYRGDKSPRVFCAGIIPANRVAYLLKPGTTVQGIVKNGDVALIAQAFECSENEVMEALCKDAGPPWDRLAGLDSAEQREAFLVVRRLSSGEHNVLTELGAERTRALLDAVSRLTPAQFSALARLSDQVGALLDASENLTARQLRAVLTFMAELVN